MSLKNYICGYTMTNNFSRREAVKTLATVATVITTGWYLRNSTTAVYALEKGDHWYGMFIDVDKCYGCYACVVACAAENNVPLSVFRTWVEMYEINGRKVFVPKLCNHCEYPSCVEPCPVNATYRDKDGVVLVDDEACIGCGACIVACPYGVRFFNPIKGVADKCTLCDHRITKGLLPACVEACPTGARVFGDLNDPESPLSRLIKDKNISVLKPWTGNKPKVFYVGLPREANK